MTSLAMVDKEVVIRSKRTGTLKAGHPALCAEPSGKVVCNRFGKADAWEHWTMEAVGNAVTFKGHHGNYLSANPSGDVYSTQSEVGDWELWTLSDCEDGVAFKSFHGKYLTAEGGEVAGWGEGDWVSANREEVGPWQMFMILPDDDSFTDGLPRAIGYTVAGTLGVISLGFLAIPVLGFTAGGVAAGSAAAGIQSVVYGGATTGVFSVLQSIGATGAWMTYAGASGVASASAGILTRRS